MRKSLIIIVGKQASGKSTLSKTITLNEQCVEGSVFNDNDVTLVNNYLLEQFKKGRIIKNLILEYHESQFAEIIKCLQYNTLFYERVIIEVVTDSEEYEVPPFLTDRVVSIIKLIIRTKDL